ncbi:response regulator [Nitrospirillum sp. BR 11752]|uniref:response regulator transcription factor n=1 Tax=Nitrospirillum sp. BR 11752 TaxID=3104293 RepID=UPI002ECBEB01|nr:response regulator [Nitrospirillum sp. BR 11752]
MTTNQPSPEAKGAIIVVDDDPSMRKALTNLFNSLDLTVHTFASTQEFLDWPLPDIPLCLVLDIRMPGQNGLDFQEEFAPSHEEIPVVFITGHGDIPMSVRAMKAGAIEFLTKPFKEQDLLDAIYAGLAKSAAHRAERAKVSDVYARYATLSPRQRQVMDMILNGQLSKQIAATLKLSEITVKICRAQLMRKMQATSLLELGRMAEKIQGVAKPNPEEGPGA